MNSAAGVTKRYTDVGLADAFALFTDAAARLEASHGDLQRQVAELRGELSDRNRALAASLADNAQIENALRRIVEQLPCGVLVLTAVRDVVLVNDEACRLLQVQACSAWEQFPARFRAAVESALSQGQQSRNWDTEVCLDDGLAKRFLAVSTSRTAPSPPAGRCDLTAAHTILTFWDITVKREMERGRDESRNMVALSEISAMLAHEIRNPLASLELFVDLLSGQISGSDAMDWLGHVRAGIRALGSIVDNVLSFYSPGCIKLSPVNLSDVLAQTIEFVRPLCEQAGIKVIVQADTGTTEIAAEVAALRQLILNLTRNALRHMSQGGILRFSAHIESGDGAELAVVDCEDTGCGIRPEDIERIFQPGFTTTASSPGLGLTVCRQIVSQHGGVMMVDSAVGRGTRFRMEFPVV